MRGLFTMFALAWCSLQATADVTIWVQATNAPKLFVFDTDGSCSGTASGTEFNDYTTWSGATMSKSVTTSDNKKWYYEVFTGLNSASIIFNDGNGKQTNDITNVSGTRYFWYNGESAYIDFTSLKGSLTTHYCFFQNNSSFTKPYVYTYDNETEGSWPGKEISNKVGHNSDGDIYYVPISGNTAPNKIIFHNNSGNQSDDLNYSDGALYWYGQNIGGSFATVTISEWPEMPVASSYTIYVRAEQAPYIYAWDNNDQTIGDTWHGTLLSTTERLDDGNYWYKITYETYDSNINFLFNDGENQQTGNISQNESVGYYVYDGTTGYVKTVAPTGKMYVIGQVNGNPWSPVVGMTMTANEDNTVFTLSNVQIISGATFSFATDLAQIDNEDAWNVLNGYRLTSAADGDFWLVTSGMTNKEGPTPMDLLKWTGDDKNFMMDETAYYNITVNLNNMTVTIKRAYNALYMYYGENWSPNAGVSMMSTDGITYTLTGVTLEEGSTFQFTTKLGDSWNEIANDRLGSNALGEYWAITTEELNMTLQNALSQGSDKDFKMEEGTAGIYRVVVNPSAGTIALFSMAEVLGSKVILHLEQTNVTNPRLWAYDKERNKENTAYIHVDRPPRTEIATNRRVFYENEEPNEAKTITTADGRKWWTWEIDNAIVDFWFTRGDYTYNLQDLEDENMTDIQWRKSGEIFLTWPATDTALDEFTRDYYVAAAQEAADCAVMIEGHKYAYFTNTPGWAHVFCHSWYTDEQGNNHDLLKPPAPYDGNPIYPGALCKLVGYDKDGYEVWRIDLTEAYEAAGITSDSKVGIIFNNGIDDNHVYEHDLNHDYYTGLATTAAKEQTGDFGYSTGTCYDYCGVIVLGRSLGNIIRNGVLNGPVYTIEEDLVAVYFDDSAETLIQVDGQDVTLYGALYCKDMNNFVTTQYVEKSLQQEGQVDYMREYYPFDGEVESIFPPRPDRYDQSNWVKLTLSTQYPGFELNNKEAQLALLSNFEGKVLPKETVNAQLVNNYNPEMRLALHALPDANSLADYDYLSQANVFITCSFIGNQTGTDTNGNTYDMFFVTPKPQEYAKITWALYNGNNEFVVCERSQYNYDNTGTLYYYNGFDLNGFFKIKWDMQDPVSLEPYQLYQFEGIIRLAEGDEGGSSASGKAPIRAQQVQPKEDNATSSRYIVSPLNLTSDDSVITGVRDLNDNGFKQVKSIQYIDVTGKISSRPFEGVNIVVTRLTDGSASTTKIIR